MNNPTPTKFHVPAENNVRILIADDDTTTRMLLTGVLKKWGYDPLAVKDGQQAWEVLQQPDSPRLAILDWEMPGMDGLDVIRLVRASASEQPPYIILLTSKEGNADLLFGLETGANDYIKKPFAQEELYARLRVGQRTIELQASLLKTQQTLLHQATHDTLTCIMNRRAILDQLEKELSRTRRGSRRGIGGGLGIGFFDIDHFKQINDHWGHQVGDEVLCGLVTTLTNHMRDYDALGRLGGDEFLIVAPDINNESIRNLFDRLQSTIANTKIQTTAGPISITVSMGACIADADSSEDHLLTIVDQAMYRAKQNGGNCVVYEQ